jgi:bacterioferritin
MKGNREIIDCLNALLANELSAVDQYLVQAHMLQDWGFTKLHERIGHETDDERGHVARLVKRILFLEGQPDVGSRTELRIGSAPREMLANDLEFEVDVARTLNDAIALCRKKGDNGTREMLEELLHDTEDDHIFWLQQQLALIEKLGLKRYLQEQL